MRGSAGYALPEVLAALVISGFVAVAATGGLHHAATLWRQTDDRLLASEDEDALSRVFVAAVERAVLYWPTRSDRAERPPLPFYGDAQSLRFFGDKPPWPDDASAALYGFSVSPAQAGAEMRYRREPVAYGESIDVAWSEQTGAFDEVSLYEGPIGWGFRYYGRQNVSTPLGWYDRWINAELAPRLIALVPDGDLERAVIARPPSLDDRRCVDAPRVEICGPTR